MSAPPQSPSERGMGFVRMVRTPETLELLQDPLAFALLANIALRARWHDGFNTNNLRLGESLIGDHKKMGFSRREYRTRLDRLKNWGFVTTRTTNRGTVATLCSSKVFDLSAFIPGQLASQQPAIKRPTAGHQAATNEEGEEGKQENKAIEKAGAFSLPAGPGNPPAPQKVKELFHHLCPSLPKMRGLTDTREAAIRSRWKAAGNCALDWFEELFRAAEASEYLSGRNRKWVGCSFDWLLKPANAQKVLEGNYANGRERPSTKDGRAVSAKPAAPVPTRQQITDWLADHDNPRFRAKAGEWTSWDRLPSHAKDELLDYLLALRANPRHGIDPADFLRFFRARYPRLSPDFSLDSATAAEIAEYRREGHTGRPTLTDSQPESEVSG